MVQVNIDLLKKAAASKKKKRKGLELGVPVGKVTPIEGPLYNDTRRLAKDESYKVKYQNCGHTGYLKRAAIIAKSSRTGLCASCVTKKKHEDREGDPSIALTPKRVNAYLRVNAVFGKTTVLSGPTFPNKGYKAGDEHYEVRHNVCGHTSILCRQSIRNKKTRDSGKCAQCILTKAKYLSDEELAKLEEKPKSDKQQKEEALAAQISDAHIMMSKVKITMKPKRRPFIVNNT